MSHSKRFVSIPEEEYEELMEDHRLLQALRDHGVDNWEGFDEAKRENGLPFHEEAQ